MKQKKVIISILLLGIGIAAQSQNATTTAGGNASGSGGTVSYSVGQVLYTTNTGSNGSVSKGVQQPFEISTVLGIEDNKISLNLKAYPNPTSDYLILSIDKIEIGSFNFQLFDISGKLFVSKFITSPNEIIHMESLANATYFLKVIRNNAEVKTFKIIKN